MPRLVYRLPFTDQHGRPTDSQGNPLKKGKRKVYEAIAIDVCLKCYKDNVWQMSIPEELSTREVEHQRNIDYDGSGIECVWCDKPLTWRDQ